MLWLQSAQASPELVLQSTLAFQGISCVLAYQQSPSMASPVYRMIVMPIATVSYSLIAAGRVQGRLQNF